MEKKQGPLTVINPTQTSFFKQSARDRVKRVLQPINLIKDKLLSH